MYEWGLIDLKRLHDDVEYWEQHDDPKQPDYDTRDIEGVIASQPIVEAIPMPWIRAYTRGPLSNKDYWAIIRMVSKWEWENEKNEV